MTTSKRLRRGQRVYINEKLVEGRRHAASSPTAITTRREGTLALVRSGDAHIHFDHLPGRTTVVPALVVFPVEGI